MGLALAALVVALIVYTMSLVAVERASPGGVVTLDVETPLPPPDVLTPFAQVDPAIVGWLERPVIRPFDSAGGRIVPVGVWLPLTGNTLFTLPTVTPYPTPTRPATPTAWPTRPPATGILPTPTPAPLDGMIPDAGVWFGGAFIESNCAPSGLPAAGPLTQQFHGRHPGIDIGVYEGTPLLATHSGQVIYAAWSDRGYGNLVIVKNRRFTTYYGHLSAFSVTAGQFVAAGTVVGLSGNTGNSTGPHLHYETRIDETPVDPLTFEARGHRHC